MIKGEMQFERWEKGMTEFSMTLDGQENPWLFIHDQQCKSRLFAHDGELVGESVDVRPLWRRWLGMLGPVIFKDAEGAVICRLERIGWSSDLRFRSGAVTERLRMEGGLLNTRYESRSLQITMQERVANVAQFDFVSSLNPTHVMLIVGHLVAYYCRF